MIIVSWGGVYGSRSAFASRLTGWAAGWGGVCLWRGGMVCGGLGGPKSQAVSRCARVLCVGCFGVFDPHDPQGGIMGLSFMCLRWVVWLVQGGVLGSGEESGVGKG